MDANALGDAMGWSLTTNRYAVMLPAFEEAMRAADITTVNRAAAWCSQIGHESVGLRYMAEIQTSGPDWSYDRTKYRGRGPLQLTWSSNYAAFGAWCVSQGYLDDPNLFVKQPELVEEPRWGFLSASWYWLNAGPRPGQINSFADAGAILDVSRCINGWVTTPNGMPDRQARWNNCLELGEALLPGEEDDMFTDDDRKMLKYVYEQLGPGDPKWTPLGFNDKGQPLTFRDALGQALGKVTTIGGVLGKIASVVKA